MKKFELLWAVMGAWFLYIVAQFGSSTIHFIPYILVAYGCAAPPWWSVPAIGFWGVFFIVDGILSAYTEVHHYPLEYVIDNYIGEDAFIKFCKYLFPVGTIFCAVFAIIFTMAGFWLGVITMVVAGGYIGYVIIKMWSR